MEDLIQHPRVLPETLVFLRECGPSEIHINLSPLLECLPALSETHEKLNTSKKIASHSAQKTDSETDGTVYQFIRRMTVSEKIEFAKSADKGARSHLIKDSNKMVALAVLGSPKITEQEVEFIAQSRNVSEEVLRTISKKREWVKKYVIIHALVNNPKTPAGIAITLLPNLKTKDLSLLLKNRGIAEPVRAVANKYLKTRART